MVACFADDVRSEQPAHPGREFAGAEQIRRNWAQILGAVPDVEAMLVRLVADADVEWCEWRWTGTRHDGGSHSMCGVTILGTAGGRVEWVRFYMEPMQQGASIDSAISEHLTTAVRS